MPRAPTIERASTTSELGESEGRRSFSFRDLLDGLCLTVLCSSAWLLAACSSAPPPAVAEAVELPTHNHRNKPPLVVIEREGDADGALGLAAYLPYGAAALRQLASSAITSLRARHIAADAEVSSDALLLTASLPQDGEQEGLVDAFRVALLQAKLQAPVPGPEPVSACDFGLGSGGAQQARRAAGYESVALAVVGGEDFVEAIADDYANAAEWPGGLEGEDAWPDADVVRVQSGAPAGELSVALRTAEAQRALSAARRVAFEDSGVMLVAKAAGWRLEGAHAGLRPRGGCLSVRVSTDAAAEATEVATLAKAISGELEQALSQAPPLSPQLAALEASTPQIAARRAAWISLTGRLEAGQPRALVTAFGSVDEGTLKSAFERREAPKLRLVSSTEAGRGRIWGVLSSPCSTAHEALNTTGHTAAALAAAAQYAQERAGRGAGRGVEVQAWWAERGLALVGSVSAAAPDAPIRLAEVLGRSLLAAASDADLVASTRSGLQDGPQHPRTFRLALRLASDARPSLLLPYPTAGSLASFDLDRSRDALRGFLGGPVALAVLSPEAGHAEQVQERLRQLLAVLQPHTHACPNTRPPKVAGEFLVDTDDAEDLATLIYPLDQPDSEAARWAAALLDGSDGWLARSIADVGLAKTVRAYALGQTDGPAALAITLEADPEGLPDAVMQTRALVERLGQRRLVKSDLERIRTTIAAEQDLNDPRQRALQLLWGAPSVVDVGALQRLLRRSLDDARLIVVRPGENEE